MSPKCRSSDEGGAMGVPSAAGKCGVWHLLRRRRPMSRSKGNKRDRQTPQPASDPAFGAIVTECKRRPFLAYKTDRGDGWFMTVIFIPFLIYPLCAMGL